MPFLVLKPPSPKMALAPENNNSLQRWCGQLKCLFKPSFSAMVVKNREGKPEERKKAWTKRAQLTTAEFQFSSK